MKAAVLTGLGEDLIIRDDVEVFGLGPKDVHVKIASSGVCHSDLSVQNGTIPQPPPVVLGHERLVLLQFDAGQQAPRAQLFVFPGKFAPMSQALAQICCGAKRRINGRAQRVDGSGEGLAHAVQVAMPEVAEHHGDGNHEEEEEVLYIQTFSSNIMI